MGKYRYREVKNYIHNELKLTKEDIKEIMVPIVKEEVKRIFQNTYGNDVDIERWVRCMVSYLYFAGYHTEVTAFYQYMYAAYISCC